MMRRGASHDKIKQNLPRVASRPSIHSLQISEGLVYLFIFFNEHVEVLLLLRNSLTLWKIRLFNFWRRVICED